MEKKISQLLPLSKELFDLVVIGGGINGVAIARDAALRGLKVILLEQRDFGCGASSKTSKLAHGGLRYLETWQFRLVKECLQERSLLLDHAFPFVRPLPFIFPAFKGIGRPLWQIKMGVFLYELLDRYGKTPKHRSLSSFEVHEMFPDLILKGLKGGSLYYDAIMEDSRLLMANMSDAEKAGAVALNDVKITQLLKENGKITGVEAWDALCEVSVPIHAKVVVNATGAWSNAILEMDVEKPLYHVAPTKGVHLVIPQVHPEVALTLLAPQDGRVFFLIPWNGETLLGTTDTPYVGDPAKAQVEEEDVQYLLKAYRAYFPDRPLTKAEIIGSFVGLRPLVEFKGVANSSKRSRDYVLQSSSSGLVTILGGKYTSHRFVAQETVDEIYAQLEKKENRSTTFSREFEEKLPSLGIGDLSRDILDLAKEENLTFQQMDHLTKTYGHRAKEIIERIHLHPEEKKQICPYHPHLFAELQHALQMEKAHRLEDWFCRRTSIAYTRCGGRYCVDATAKEFATFLRWDEGQMHLEKARWLQQAKKSSFN